MHLSDGALRRSLDEPVAIDARSRGHLESCERCRRRLSDVSADAARAGALFASREPAVHVEAARLRLAGSEAAASIAAPGRNARHAPAPRRPLGTWGGRLMAGVACAAAASVLLVVSGGAQDFLSLFQPSQFAAVPVTATDVRSLAGLTGYGTVNGGSTPLQITPEANAAAAGELAGIVAPEISVPAGVAVAPRYAVVNGTVVSFTFLARLARAAAARSGGQLPAMPSGLDGSTLTVSINPAVIISYGLDVSALYGGGGTLPSSGPAIVVVASRTPTVSSTGVTVQALEDYLLAVPGIPAGVASEIRAIRNPDQTVPIPIPIDLASAATVSINGVSGLLIGDSTGLGSVVLWQHNGVVYVVAGTVSATDALGMARSLH
ncbi:MAG TPA: hypothetical protein VMU65_16160 [Candidatus Saccharimonadales bacterium]|nr:hypothetical protein [Candidatus Saccharimonadales bacterium]